MKSFDLPNIPSAFLSCHADGSGWSGICNGTPFAQGTYDECVKAAERMKVVLPDYYWSGELGKWLSFHLEPVNTLDIVGYPDGPNEDNRPDFWKEDAGAED